MAAAPEARACPFCHEPVKADATRCMHCRSMIPQGRPDHKGTCPFCKEAIKPEAIKCRHCGSVVGGLGVRPWSDDDCGCGEKRGSVDPASIRILDVDPGSLPEPGVAEAPRGYGCSECKDGNGLIVTGRWVHRAGTRTCSMMVPIRIGADGVITWKRIQWTEDCKGTLVNDPWA